MIDKELLDLLRRELWAEAGPRPAVPGCLDDDTVAALVDGSLDASARAEALPHLAACPRCRATVASVAAALGDPAVAREIRVVTGLTGRRLRRLAIPAAAAAAVILLLSWPPATEHPQYAHRAPTITAAPAPAPVSPMGAVASVPVLRWAAVDGADRYRVTVFDADGTTLYDTELADIVAAVPDTVRLLPGRTYLWKVEARTDFDRWVGSELVEFSIAGARR